MRGVSLGSPQGPLGTGPFTRDEENSKTCSRDSASCRDGTSVCVLRVGPEVGGR